MRRRLVYPRSNGTSRHAQETLTTGETVYGNCVCASKKDKPCRGMIRQPGSPVSVGWSPGNKNGTSDHRCDMGTKQVLAVQDRWLDTLSGLANIVLEKQIRCRSFAGRLVRLAG